MPEEDIMTLQEALKDYQKAKAARRRRKMSKPVETRRPTTQIDIEGPVSTYLGVVDERWGNENAETRIGEATTGAAERTSERDMDVAMREGMVEGMRAGGRVEEEML